MNAFRLALIPTMIAATFGTARAAVEDTRFYVAPMFSYALEDDDRHADDGMGGTLAIGAMLTETISLELRGYYLNYGETDTVACGAFNANTCKLSDSKKNNYFGGAGVNFYLAPSGSGPYLHADVTAGTNTAFNAGLGWDLAFSPGGWGLRAEALYHVQKSEDAGNGTHDFNEPLFNIGLRIPFGSAPPAPPPPPEPVQIVRRHRRRRRNAATASTTTATDRSTIRPTRVAPTPTTTTNTTRSARRPKPVSR